MEAVALLICPLDYCIRFKGCHWGHGSWVEKNLQCSRGKGMGSRLGGSAVLLLSSRHQPNHLEKENKRHFDTVYWCLVQKWSAHGHFSTFFAIAWRTKASDNGNLPLLKAEQSENLLLGLPGKFTITLANFKAKHLLDTSGLESRESWKGGSKGNCKF